MKFKMKTRSTKLEIRNNIKIRNTNVQNKLFWSFLGFCNSDLFRISILEFRI